MNKNNNQTYPQTNQILNQQINRPPLPKRLIISKLTHTRMPQKGGGRKPTI
jgi:hypothetical protein